MRGLNISEQTVWGPFVQVPGNLGRVQKFEETHILNLGETFEVC